MENSCSTFDVPSRKQLRALEPRFEQLCGARASMLTRKISPYARSQFRATAYVTSPASPDKSSGARGAARFYHLCDAVLGAP